MSCSVHSWLTDQVATGALDGERINTLEDHIPSSNNVLSPTDLPALSFGIKSTILQVSIRLVVFSPFILQMFSVRKLFIKLLYIYTVYNFFIFIFGLLFRMPVTKRRKKESVLRSGCFRLHERIERIK